jgi:hypothetical protein
MPRRSNSRVFWGFCLAGIVAAGILSRIVHTGLAAFDKYLGDALYAAMVYALFRLLRTTGPVAVWTSAVMLAIELFQLTMLPARMLASNHLMVRLCARLLGTQFSYLDLVAYAVGIGFMYLVDSSPAER